MDFSFTETQLMVRESMRRTLADGGEPSVLADLGIYSLLLSEDDGGLGGNSVDAMIVMEEFGRAVRANDFIETAVIAGQLIALCGNPSQRSGWLPLIAAGAISVAFVGSEFGIRFERSGDDVRLSGHAAIVPQAGAANLLLVVGRLDHLACAALVRSDAAGLALMPLQTVDRVSAAAVSFDAVTAEVLGRHPASAAAIDTVLDMAVVAQCAERVGLMATLINGTVDQLRTRRQFDTLLGDFQALQHRLADMAMDYELAGSITMKASIACQHGSDVERSKAVSAARVATADAARRVGHEAIQMHGGMGMTEELVVGPAVRRIRGLDARLGDSSSHLERYRTLRRGVRR